MATNLIRPVALTLTRAVARSLTALYTAETSAIPPPTGYTISSTSGTAPMMVHFSADFSGDATGFHYYDYTWDFDDPTSGTWGTTGNSRNAAKGPVTGHVFETAGTYAVTLTVRGFFGNVVASQTFNITVADPDVTFAGTDTVCVNPAGDTDFTGAPSGCVQLSTDDMSVVTPYAVAGTRILFKRGASWTVSAEPSWPNNAGPVHIGAYGSGTQDASGRYTNAPEFTMVGASFMNLENKQNRTIMHLNFVDGGDGGTIGGNFNFRDWLFFRLHTTGFNLAYSNYHANSPSVEPIQRISYVDCFSTGAQTMAAFVGSEYLAMMGNEFEDVQDSHVLRIWQSYKGVVSNNKISGASVAGTTGRQALKLHGAQDSEIESTGNDYLRHRTEFTVVSDNIFGASNPWPISIGPQDNFKFEKLSHIIIERNKYIFNVGLPSTQSVRLSIGFRLLGKNFTVRNNIVDGSNVGSSLGEDFSGFEVVDSSPYEISENISIYNNTIYKFDTTSTNYRYGVQISDDSVGTVVKNNLFITSKINNAPFLAVKDNGINTTQSNNVILLSNTELVDPDNVDPLARDYSLLPTATNCIDQGTTIESVYEDFAGSRRSLDLPFDIGAYEFAVESYALFKPSGADSLITFDGDTFKVRD